MQCADQSAGHVRVPNVAGRYESSGGLLSAEGSDAVTADPHTDK
jgi:hypothetical protein